MIASRRPNVPTLSKSFDYSNIGLVAIISLQMLCSVFDVFRFCVFFYFWAFNIFPSVHYLLARDKDCYKNVPPTSPSPYIFLGKPVHISRNITVLQTEIKWKSNQNLFYFIYLTTIKTHLHKELVWKIIVCANKGLTRLYVGLWTVTVLITILICLFNTEVFAL